MRMNKEDTRILSNYSEYEALVKDDTTLITKTTLSEDGEYLLASTKSKMEGPSLKGNLIAAVFTTSYARCHLYELCAAYSKYIAYMDTDSVVIFRPSSEKPPPTSSAIGELKVMLSDINNPFITKLSISG